MGLGQGSYSRDYATSAGAEHDGCYTRFHMEAEEIEVDGKKVYRDVEMVEIFMPGNPTTKPDMLVTDEFRKRWPVQYKAFKDNLEMPLDGVPLEEWNILSPAQLRTLKSFEFRTVEDVASMTENAVQRVGLGARQLKLKAIAYLDENEKSKIVNKALADAEKFERRCAEQDEQIRRLNDLLRQQGEQISQLATQNDFNQRNIASTPQMIPGAQPLPNYEQQVVSPFAAFAKFSEEDPPQPEALPPGETVTVAPPQPPRKPGRPTNAELAARRAA